MKSLEQQVADRLNDLDIPADAFNTPVLQQEFIAWKKGKRLLVVTRGEILGQLYFIKPRNKKP